MTAEVIGQLPKNRRPASTIAKLGSPTVWHVEVGNEACFRVPFVGICSIFPTFCDPRVALPRSGSVPTAHEAFLQIWTASGSGSEQRRAMTGFLLLRNTASSGSATPPD